MAERKSPLRLSVVIPVYNERRAIEELLCRVQAVEVDKEIICRGQKNHLEGWPERHLVHPTL